MDLVSLSPLRVASLFWQPQQGTHALTVVCKATFALAPGAARLAEVQDDPAEEDQHHESDPARSLYLASDLAPFKSKADVALVGDAFAPGGLPAHSVVARLVVGAVDKSIEVHCDRHFDQHGRLVEGEPFSRMSLRYEHAATGPRGDNPVGIAPGGAPDRFGRRLLPNLQAAGTTLQTPVDAIEAVGFGPLAPGWPKRRAVLGRHRSSWSDRDWFLRPLPTDLDGSFFNAAPADQQLTELRESERIVLENLHAGAESLVCDLPGLKPRGFIERGRDVRELSLRPDTLWIDTTRAVCTLTWRGRVDLHRPDEQGRVLIAKQAPGEHLTWADVRRIAESESGVQEDITADVVLPTAALFDEHTAVGPVGDIGRRALPFEPAVDRATPPPVRPASRAQAPGGGFTGAMELIQVGDRAPAWMTQDQPPPGNTKSDAFAAPPGSRAQPSSHAPAPTATAPASAMPTSTARQDSAPAAAAASSPWARSGEPAGASDTSKTEPQAPAAAVAGAGDGVAMGSTPPPTPAGLSGQGALDMPQPPAVRPPNPVAALRQRAAESYGATTEEASERQRGRVAVPAPAEIVELLWYDEGALDKLRAQPHFADLLADLEQPRDAAGPIDFDEPPPPEEPQPVRDRRAVVAVMTQGPISSTAALHQTMLESVDGTGSFEPPLVLLSGRLQFPFDELATLKATVSAIAPLTAGNKELQETVDTVNELLQTPWLQSSGEVAENLTDKVRAAFKRGDRMIDPGYLDLHTERTLLAQRCYQKRDVFGQQWIRALMLPAAARAPVPTYLPEALASELPMFKSFTARVIAEAHAQQDQYESHDSALKVVALGRVIDFRGAGRR